MSRPNPTVTLNVTAKELDLIYKALGYNTPQGTLRDKLNQASKDMILANRQKNRANKQARLSRRQLLLGNSYSYQHGPMPVSDFTAEQLAVADDD